MSDGIDSPLKVRPNVRGKFLHVGDQKLYLRGVTYGTFAEVDGQASYPDRSVVAADFAAMAENGINCVRTYTPPPSWLLDLAGEQGLWVAAGIAWEEHVAFLDDPKVTSRIVDTVREAARSLSGHPALLCLVVGNEIPQEIVRWHGNKSIEGFLNRLYRTIKQESPDDLVTYVNYPTTEYLDLSFFDFLSFNVYLESREELAPYVARLQTIADERPLVLMELGLDSRRNGESLQADSLSWQIETVFAGGAAGAFVFAWTDEWHRSGHEILDWDFGLTDRSRRPKLALEAVATAFRNVPFSVDRAWPSFSVVVCSYNGEPTIRDTLEGLSRLEYPNFEVIVVNDGSADATPAIASEFDVQLISTENRGLSNARNTGAWAATGEIVAYIDDDAWPDPHWLQYLAHSFEETGSAGAGGPNLPPPGDGLIADCVSNSPGGPIHVLLTDEIAEHVPGCNMAFRREALTQIGGFDPGLRVAGDDVDICWRIQDEVGPIAFSPAAMVWHHRRNSVHRYWRQQIGYGRAEALLEQKWPEKYNAAGYHPWHGRIYSRSWFPLLGLNVGRIYQGVWGSAPFQRLYEPSPGILSSIPLMPEWHVLTLAMAAITALGLSWGPLLLAGPLAITALALSIAHAIVGATRARYTTTNLSRTRQLGLRALTAAMYFMQPIARLRGRLEFGLTPWRPRGAGPLPRPIAQTEEAWSERWQMPAAYREQLRSEIQAVGSVTAHGDDDGQWDISARGGLLGSARVLLSVEEHGDGKQLVRARAWPFVHPQVLLAAGTLVLLAWRARADRARVAPLVLAVLGIGLLVRAIRETSLALRSFQSGFERFAGEVSRPIEVEPDSPTSRSDIDQQSGLLTISDETTSETSEETNV